MYKLIANLKCKQQLWSSGEKSKKVHAFPNNNGIVMSHISSGYPGASLASPKDINWRSILHLQAQVWSQLTTGHCQNQKRTKCHRSIPPETLQNMQNPTFFWCHCFEITGQQWPWQRTREKLLGGHLALCGIAVCYCEAEYIFCWKKNKYLKKHPKDSWNTGCHMQRSSTKCSRNEDGQKKPWFCQ